MKKREILRLLLSMEAYSQAELSRILGYSKAAVMSLVNEMKDDGLIEEKGEGESSPAGGKKPRILGVREKGVYLFTVGGAHSRYSFSHAEISLVNLKGRKKDSGILHMPEDIGGEEILKKVAGEIERQKTNLLKSEPGAKVIAAAIAVGGRVDPVEGTIIYGTGRLEKLAGVPVTRRIEAATGVRSYIEDCVVFPAYKEYFLGEAAGYKSFVYLEVLPFIRAIIFLNGSLYLGSSFLAGEIGGSVGVMGDRENEYLCELFDHEIFGLPLVKDRVEKKFDSNIVYDFQERAKRGAMVNDGLKLGRLARLTGQVIVNMVFYLDLPLIVLGGIPDGVRDEFESKLNDEMQKHLNTASPGKVEVRFAKNGRNNKTMGFVCFAADKIFHCREVT